MLKIINSFIMVASLLIALAVSNFDKIEDACLSCKEDVILMNSTETELEEDIPCEDGVDTIDYGKNRLIGCWGNDGTCKIKCK